MKIYTKTGDKGSTGLLGGTRVPKYHARIHAYGTVDELNAIVGMLRDTTDLVAVNEELQIIQSKLFTLGSQLAADPDKLKMEIPNLAETDVAFLESRMDAMDSTLPELKSFVLAGGSLASSTAHLARTVCRRAERHTVELAADVDVNDIFVIYLNRLSDYFFMLARYILHQEGGGDQKWDPTAK